MRNSKLNIKYIRMACDCATLSLSVWTDTSTLMEACHDHIMDDDGAAQFYFCIIFL